MFMCIVCIYIYIYIHIYTYVVLAPEGAPPSCRSDQASSANAGRFRSQAITILTIIIIIIVNSEINNDSNRNNYGRCPCSVFVLRREGSRLAERQPCTSI